MESAWKFLPTGALELAAIENSDFADATLVHIAKREALSAIFTVDYADFETYRIDGPKRFRVLPAKRP